RKAKLQLKQAERRALIEIEDARVAFEKTTAEREAYAKSAEAAEKNYRAQLNDLRTSIATVLDVIQALQDLQNARNALFNAEYQEKISRLRYFVALGYLFPESKF
ncbi:MAG TPA: TolC family protein, partial [Turneriella sp.]|nr:TolC family protein [Turneriella sp.]